ncbi:MAG TPA: peptidylprolyl isomerase [Actinophytocola sp.]|nr:peptidylprolyl isomerase [Actinophytocola sp.]
MRAGALVVLTAAVLLAGCTSRTVGEPVAGEIPLPAPAPSATAPSSSSAVDGCEYVETPGEEASVGLPTDVTADHVVLATASGQLPIALTPAETPCTVRSFAHLVDQQFYDGTVCHRLTNSAGLKVLQCGDPKGDGTGGPGYTIPDELPTTLPPAADGLVTYPRGTVAMANAGPSTGGSQFFLVYGDSTLPPDYAVFGTVEETGLTTLDTIAARGIAPGGSCPEDGAPAERVDLVAAVIG